MVDVSKLSRGMLFYVPVRNTKRYTRVKVERVSADGKLILCDIERFGRWYRRLEKAEDVVATWLTHDEYKARKK